MVRKTKKVDFHFSLADLEKLENHYKVVTYLNSNSEQNISYLALGVKRELNAHNTIFKDLELFLDEKDWVFGYFGYDLKNQLESNLSSSNQDFVSLNEAHFFIPKLVLELTPNNQVIHYVNEDDLVEFLAIISTKKQQEKLSGFQIKYPDPRVLGIKSKYIYPLNSRVGELDIPQGLNQRVSKEDYIKNLQVIKSHLKAGDIYEMNYCHEFYAENCEINPYKVYKKLNELTNAPFSSFYKNKDQFILSGSPERFLKKEGDKIISQPIKGTAKRGKDSKEDEEIKNKLANDPKERSENIMIVDLVRNDLSKTAAKGSVKVEELCKVYSFDTVHQMISTVSSQLKKGCSSLDVIKHAFPMGSMTGAPKYEAMQIIDQLESTKRGVYSGALGYIKPNGDFDFNVLIRTILYNRALKRTSFMVGGAITLKSNIENEYQETLLKAEALKKALE